MKLPLRLNFQENVRKIHLRSRRDVNVIAIRNSSSGKPWMVLPDYVVEDSEMFVFPSYIKTGIALLCFITNNNPAVLRHDLLDGILQGVGIW